ncbi:MAG: hypothetical protein A3H51_01525 [Candidatus Spechtbacteria bacterium RIFCSPLOWO2_02_FULL_38_8]|uniref:Cell division protein FtsL n=1 Tax=Candidatus Spechtbacteria bacterium RIFCSPLOWO2_02_FULL_38_8 TaxID=1802164 RepID=A0A1G2HJM4_9BACT|nr:MAG: hypothetical protein A3H51_01525 [Candidatus Spechtbacteria bacterium RIFCSPLOWO2_02_FULL_38_8]
MKHNFQRTVSRLQKKKSKNEFVKLLKRKSKPHAIPLLFIFVVALFLFIIVGQIKRTYSIYSTADKLESELNKIEQENKNLEAQIGDLKSLEAIDKEARERLNLKKEGEEVVIIIPKETSGVPQEEAQQKQKDSFWSKVINFFK